MSRQPMIWIFVLLLVVILAGCQGAATATTNTQATVQAMVAAQMATLTASVPTSNYPATIQAQGTQLAVLQNTMTAPTQPPAPTPTPDETTAIRNALATYLAWPPSQVEMEIAEIRPDGTAQGVVQRVGETMGAAWFAAKVEGVWLIAYVGQGVPPCERVNPLHIPTEWVDYCEQGSQTVHR